MEIDTIPTAEFASASIVQQAYDKIATGDCETLDLQMLCIDDTCLKICCVGLANHQSLRALDLGMNNISDGGIAIAAHCFANLPNLRSLELSENYIEDAGAQCLVPLCKSKLVNLNLRGNRVSDQGARLFLACIKSGSSLVSLDLSSNLVSSLLELEISQAIIGAPGKKRKTLENL